jgi:2-hydroxychromene-2-carboxylate isomerase
MDTFRTAHRLGVPFRPPPAHPFNPLLALRVSSLPMRAAERARVVDALFAVAWGGAHDGKTGLDDAATVTAALTRAGLDGGKLVVDAQSDENKARLKTRTEQALAEGCFGVPTLLVDGKLFWGLDAFPHVDDALSGRDPLTNEILARWKDLPSTAQRK